MVADQQPIISVRNLHKWYSGVHALKGVSLDFRRNEAVGLVGDNGAGKSTLISILAGLHPKDEGEILVDGNPVEITNPRDAMNLGIETIYQYNSMVPNMSIARNMFIGREPLKLSVMGFGLLDEARMRAESVAAIANVDLHLRSPDALVGELSGGQRQGVAIARARLAASRSASFAARLMLPAMSTLATPLAASQASWSRSLRSCDTSADLRASEKASRSA